MGHFKQTVGVKSVSMFFFQKAKDTGWVRATQVTKMIICLHEGDLILLGVCKEIAVEKFAITKKVRIFG